MPEIQFPNESPEYRTARRALLEAEVALREQTERVARLRRELPLGGEVPEDYEFVGQREGAAVPVKLSELFSEGKDTLFVYGLMYGAQAEKPCPLCSSFLDSLDGNVPHLRAKIDVAVVARAGLPTLRALAEGRGWKNLDLLSAGENDYPKRYWTESPQGSPLPMAHVFVRREGTIRHSWGSEMLFAPSGETDSRHVDMLWPLWNVLDLTPTGRGDGYPKLSY